MNLTNTIAIIYVLVTVALSGNQPTLQAALWPFTTALSFLTTISTFVPGLSFITDTETRIQALEADVETIFNELEPPAPTPPAPTPTPST